MSDTIQAVRVDDDIETRVVHQRMEFWHEDEQQWFSLGAVIELTEERTERRLRSPVPTQGRRWVSKWEVKP